MYLCSSWLSLSFPVFTHFPPSQQDSEKIVYIYSLQIVNPNILLKFRLLGSPMTSVLQNAMVNLRLHFT